MLSLANITVRIAGRTILDDVSITAASGEVLALLGPNGAGKSTMMRVASGELEPIAGSVALFERPLREVGPREAARRRAVLPQLSALSFGFTVMEVVLLGRMPHGKTNDPEIAAEVIAAVGLQGFEDRDYLSLSGGERQRVHLARVLAQIWETGEDRVLLLDEPTAALDLVHQHGTLSLARRMARRGVAVIAVLHDLNLASLYADRIALLSRGQLAALGTPGEVLRPMVLEPVFGLPIDVLELADPKQWVVLARDIRR